MSETKEIRKALHQRLAPLYISTFFQSFVLWYTVEKLFMRSIGFSNTGIGLMIALYSAVMLIVETPSGILADRWSRKGVLMLASVCLSLCSLIGGLSNGPGLYLIAAVLWGIFFACYSGMYDSIVYDTLAEVVPGRNLFDYFYGRIQLCDGIGLVLGSLVGALIASATSLRTPYFVTVPLVLIPLVALWKFKEPTLHKQDVVIPLYAQLKATFRAVTRNRAIFPVVIVLVLRSMLAYCIFEFSQLWLIQLHTQTAYYGVANATLLSSIGLGGMLVSRLKLDHCRRILVMLVVMLMGSIGLIVFRSTFSVVVSQFLFASSLIAIYVIFSRLLHDNLPASLRAGAASATSSLGRMAVIPTALALGYLSQHFTIYKAGYVLLGLAVLMSIFVKMVIGAKRITANELEPTLSA